jgi:DNA helicase-2/ATP-dependent DNA helicase PcrA
MVAKKFPLDYRKKPFQVPNDLSRGLKTGDDEKALFLKEERRLCYVAMTRAEEHLYFTLARGYGELKTERKPPGSSRNWTFSTTRSSMSLRCRHPGTRRTPAIASKAEEYLFSLQEQARDAISRMQLHTADQRLVELEKFRLLREGKKEIFESRVQNTISSLGNLIFGIGLSAA